MPDRSSIMFNMNRMPIQKRAQILGLLVEGNSLRAASRLADCSINTVTKLLVDVGTACGALRRSRDWQGPKRPNRELL